MRWLTMVAVFGLAGCLPMEDGTMGLRIDTPQAADAYQGAGGGTGHWQDTDPDGGTEQSAEWTEFVQEAICETIEGLGGTLDGTESGQLWALLAPRVEGIRSHATDTGVVTTAHLRVVVGATNSRASTADAVVLASQGSEAGGFESAMMACSGGKTSAPISTVLSSWLGFASDEAAQVLASSHVENATKYSVAGGKAAAITPNGTNQNQSWRIESDGGNAHLAGVLKIGGDVDAGTGALASVDGATGLGVFTGGVRVAHGANKQVDTLTTSAVINALTNSTLLNEANTYGDTGALVQAWISGYGGAGIPIVINSYFSAGSVYVVLRNIDPTVATDADIVIGYRIENPAP